MIQLYVHHMSLKPPADFDPPTEKEMRSVETSTSRKPIAILRRQTTYFCKYLTAGSKVEEGEKKSIERGYLKLSDIAELMAPSSSPLCRRWRKVRAQSLRARRSWSEPAVKLWS